METRRSSLSKHRELSALVAIRVEDASKTFNVYVKREGAFLKRIRRDRRRVNAVERISFEIERGEIVGYIGPNGAGKSTTVKMLSGILVPSSGLLRVLGMDPSRERIELARRIGVVFGQRTQLWWDLPLVDSFELLRYIYRIPENTYRRNLARFIEVLELSDFLRTPVRQLSLGQRMRGDLAAAMLHEPEILFLDEPTIGLDVVAKARIREFLNQVNSERQTTILLTTHDMGDVERLCRRVMIIDHGHVIYDGDLRKLKERFRGETLLVVDLEEEGAHLHIPGAEVIKTEGPRRWLRFRRDEFSAASLISQVAQQVKLVDLALEEPAIEDVITRLYREGL